MRRPFQGAGIRRSLGPGEFKVLGQKLVSRATTRKKLPRFVPGQLLSSRRGQATDSGRHHVRSFLLNRYITGFDPYTANLDHAYGQDPKRSPATTNRFPLLGGPSQGLELNADQQCREGDDKRQHSERDGGPECEHVRSVSIPRLGRGPAGANRPALETSRNPPSKTHERGSRATSEFASMPPAEHQRLDWQQQRLNAQQQRVHKSSRIDDMQPEALERTEFP